MTSGDPAARTLVGWQRLASLIVAAGFAMTACSGQAATPRATSVATSRPPVSARETTSPGGGHDVAGDYSPDGRQIVFVRGIHVDEEHNTLMVVNADGSDPRVLTDRTVRLGSRWSPAGKVILTESAGSLLLVPLDGGRPSPITIDGRPALKAIGGGWSPDGSWIVFSRVTPSGEDIYIMRKDGTNLHQITDTPGVDEEFGEWGRLP